MHNYAIKLHNYTDYAKKMQLEKDDFVIKNHLDTDTFCHTIENIIALESNKMLGWGYGYNHKKESNAQGK